MKLLKNRKEFEKKMTLNKTSIARLDDESAGAIRGGRLISISAPGADVCGQPATYDGSC